MQDLINKFRENLQKIPLYAPQKILVAVSGGVDSMVLCDLFLKSGIQFSVAHCNFQLRGTDSDVDEEFVRNYCLKNQIEFHSKKFNVKEYKQSGNFSTQMAARDMRYAWLRKLISQHGFDYLATAHHLNDSLETFLINLSRGTGIDGLKGIQLKQNEIIRPLYDFTKNEILNYARENQITWREDVSNAQNDYIRNKIRNQIVPVLNEIHPGFLRNFEKSTGFLAEMQNLVEKTVEEKRNQLFVFQENDIIISIETLKNSEPLHSWLFYLFSPFGFKHPNEIEKLMNAKENGEIRSKTHRLIKNRNELLLAGIHLIEPSTEFMMEEDVILEKPLSLKFSKSKERDLNAAETLDYDKIKFPVRLRKKKTGDVFFPFGMNGSKKLSKFFKDEKYSKPEKENTWLMVDDEGKILYVVGKRIDNRFRITEHTHKFLNIYH
jgi:tRNA(Ile)-lysidine synthase